MRQPSIQSGKKREEKGGGRSQKRARIKGKKLVRRQKRKKKGKKGLLVRKKLRKVGSRTDHVQKQGEGELGTKGDLTTRQGWVRWARENHAEEEKGWQWGGERGGKKKHPGEGGKKMMSFRTT